MLRRTRADQVEPIYPDLGTLAASAHYAAVKLQRSGTSRLLPPGDKQNQKVLLCARQSGGFTGLNSHLLGTRSHPTGTVTCMKMTSVFERRLKTTRRFIFENILLADSRLLEREYRLDRSGFKRWTAEGEQAYEK